VSRGVVVTTAGGGGGGAIAATGIGSSAGTSNRCCPPVRGTVTLWLHGLRSGAVASKERVPGSTGSGVPQASRAMGCPSSFTTRPGGGLGTSMVTR
jgi:hypothetical protein